MGKGATKASENQVGIDNSVAFGHGARSGQEYGQLFPFLSGEINNPQGFGTQALDQMITQGGESAAGATGAAGEEASLLGSRTGNTAAAPAIIGATARNAAKQQSNNVLGADIANAREKVAQQQAGAAGLGNLYGTDVSAALKALGLADNSLEAWNQADRNTTAAQQGWTQLGENLIPKQPPGSGSGGGG